MLTIGTNAPDFTLKGIDQGRVADFSLKPYRKKWLVLFFYPADLAFKSLLASGLEFFVIAVGAAGFGYLIGLGVQYFFPGVAAPVG